MTVSEFFEPENWLSSSGGLRYLQLRQRIKEGIENGTLPPETHLPTEREIAAITGLSRVTVRKAVGALVSEGLIRQRRGAGSFIAPKIHKVEQSLSHLSSFTEDMARRGFSVDSKWLERGLFLPTPEEEEVLNLEPGDSVVRIARLRSADGVPMAIERASLSLEMVPNPLEIEDSLYQYLSKRGCRPVRAVQRISATNLDSSNSELLHTETGKAGLKIERISYLPDGQVVEFTRSIYRGDAYDFVAELEIKSQSLPALHNKESTPIGGGIGLTPKKG